MDTAIIVPDMQSKALKVFDFMDIKETSRADYKARLGMFTRFIEENGLTRNIFLEFKRELECRADLSVSTKNKYLTTARIFLKELNRQGVVPVDITHNIKNFKASRKHKREGLNDTEISAVSLKLRRYSTEPYETRLKAIIALLTLQGLRQIEVTRLDVNDIDFVNKTARIHGKGRDDDEPIDLHPETVKALQEYLKSNRIADGALFTSRSNNSRHQRLTTRALRGLVKDALTELGINKTTHGFRHYFVTKLL